METTLTYLETLVQETHKPEAEVMAMAFQTGLRQLWRERILGQYLRGEMTAVKLLKQWVLIGWN